eukprot:COSAG01_NODE_56085_length_320_cov_4.470588_2_plen_25_part_01
MIRTRPVTGVSTRVGYIWAERYSIV